MLRAPKRAEHDATCMPLSSLLTEQLIPALPAIHVAERSAMALARALSGLRSAVLANVRIGSSRTQQTVGKAACLTLLRGFAEGTYLDKGQVTERILDVVKNFDKVEPTKVSSVNMIVAPQDGKPVVASGPLD